MLRIFVKIIFFYLHLYLHMLLLLLNTCVKNKIVANCKLLLVKSCLTGRRKASSNCG